MAGAIFGVGAKSDRPIAVRLDAQHALVLEVAGAPMLRHVLERSCLKRGLSAKRFGEVLRELIDLELIEVEGTAPRRYVASEDWQKEAAKLGAKLPAKALQGTAPKAPAKAPAKAADESDEDEDEDEDDESDNEDNDNEDNDNEDNDESDDDVDQADDTCSADDVTEEADEADELEADDELSSMRRGPAPPPCNAAPVALPPPAPHFDEGGVPVTTPVTSPVASSEPPCPPAGGSAEASLEGWLGERSERPAPEVLERALATLYRLGAGERAAVVGAWEGYHKARRSVTDARAKLDAVLRGELAPRPAPAPAAAVAPTEQDGERVTDRVLACLVASSSAMSVGDVAQAVGITRELAHGLLGSLLRRGAIARPRRGHYMAVRP